MVKIWAAIVLPGVEVTVPKYPKTKKLTTNKAKKNLLQMPLYLIDFTGLLSNQGKATNIAIPAAMTTKPKNFADNPNNGKVTARNIAQ